MKILIFTTQFYSPSGAERLSMQLALELIRQGHDVDFLSMYDNSSCEVKDAEKALNALGINNIRYLCLPVDPGIKDIVSGIFRLRKLFKLHQYDIVETSSIGPMIIASWASCMMNVSVLGGIHAVYAKAMHNTKKQQLWRFTTRFIKKIKLYAISNAVADAWCEYASISHDRISVIYNAIDDEYFKVNKHTADVRFEFNIPDDAKVISFVGNIVMYKGVDTLIDAVGPILEEYNAYVVLVGKKGRAESFFAVDPEVYEQFYCKIKKSSWKDRVVFTGLRSDVSAIMASSDLLVHPARTEGFGLVIAEALASGLPVIASDVGGIPEVLRETDSVMLPADDPVKLRESVIQVLSLDDDQRNIIIEKGKKKATQYSAEKRATSLVNYAID